MDGRIFPYLEQETCSRRYSFELIWDETANTAAWGRFASTFPASSAPSGSRENLLLGDWSVRFLNENASLNTVIALLTRNRGEVVSVD